MLTVNVGSGGRPEEVADSTAEEALSETELAAPEAEELASLRTD